MDKFRQVSTELWPLIDIINWVFTIFGISLTIFFKLCMKRSSFEMIFFALKISRGGVCCMPAALLFELGIPNRCMVASWVCSAMYQFCDLDLIFRIIVSGA